MAATETKAPQFHADDNRRPEPSRGVLHNDGRHNNRGRRNGRWSGYRHLLWVRILELKREPEVVFWVFGFPLLLAAGLGIAFRNKPADVTSVVIIGNEGAQKTLDLLRSSTVRSATSKSSAIRATVLDRDAALKAFHFGRYDLAIE